MHFTCRLSAPSTATCSLLQCHGAAAQLTSSSAATHATPVVLSGLSTLATSSAQQPPAWHPRSNGGWSCLTFAASYAKGKGAVGTAASGAGGLCATKGNSEETISRPAVCCCSVVSAAPYGSECASLQPPPSSDAPAQLWHHNQLATPSLSTAYCLQMCPCLWSGGKQKGGAAKSKAAEAEPEVSDFDLQPVEK